MGLKSVDTYRTLRDRNNKETTIVEEGQQAVLVIRDTTEIREDMYHSYRVGPSESASEILRRFPIAIHADSPNNEKMFALSVK